MDFKRQRRKRSAPTDLDMEEYQNQEKDIPSIISKVNSIFEKSFTVVGNEMYTLPESKSLFVERPWEVEKLQKMKTELNEVKSKLNNYCFVEWHQHTSWRNKAKDIEWRVRKQFNPEFVTQAWCKFHEIISKYSLVPKEYIFSNGNKFLSVHLCEAPGAFVTCLNHWLKTNVPTIHWDWLAMTFNPYYEGNSRAKMISDDRFIMHSLNHWYFGLDNTGNLMALENLDGLIEKSKTRGKVNLVTADGSVDCIDNPGEQEGIVAGLHFCETVAAIHLLENEGNFLLKIFTTFEHQSICLLYFLSCAFRKIHFYKPVTSKEGNSEVYVVCLGFKGYELIFPYLEEFRRQYGETHKTAMFKRTDIPESFVEQIISCAQLFKQHQCAVIEDNIKAYPFKESNSNFDEKRVAKLVADKFLIDFPLDKLHVDLQIAGNVKIMKSKNNYWIVEPPSESFNEKQKSLILEPIFRLLMYEGTLKSFQHLPQTFILKPSNQCIDISINVGKPYRRVQSSRFCSVQVSDILNLFLQALDMGKSTNLCLPIEENVLKFESDMQALWNNKYKILKFQYTQIYNNNETIAIIKHLLDDLEKGDDLIFFGLLLLTQFNVGLIYLLLHTFESVEITIDEQVGCVITFKYFIRKESILQNIEEIINSAKIAEANNAVVLSIISMTELYGSELYPIIVKTNYHLAKYCIDYIASLYENHGQQNREPVES